MLDSMVPTGMAGWSPDYVDPDNFAWPFAHSEGPFMGWMGYDNGRVDELIELAKRETNPATRQDYYNEMQELVAFDQPCIYLYQPKEFRVWRAWLRGSGLEFNPIHGIYWYHIYKDYRT